MNGGKGTEVLASAQCIQGVYAIDATRDMRPVMEQSHRNKTKLARSARGIATAADDLMIGFPKGSNLAHSPCLHSPLSLAPPDSP